MTTTTISAMKLGSRGEHLIKSYETLSLTAYMPTQHDRPTIGWGSTRGVKMGDKIDLAAAQARFRIDTASAVLAVNRGVKCKLTQSMFDALVSLVFKAGPETIKPFTSTIGHALELQAAAPPGTVRHYYTAWAGFVLWRTQAGRDLLGLARRRAQEMALFLDDGIPK